MFAATHLATQVTGQRVWYGSNSLYHPCLAQHLFLWKNGWLVCCGTILNLWLWPVWVVCAHTEI